MPKKNQQQLPVEQPQTPTAPVGRTEFEQIKNLIYGFLIVAGFAIITLVIQYFTATQTTFQGLKDQIIEQNAKIDALTNAVYGSKTPTPQTPVPKTTP